ncbi:serine/threonine protein kinase [Streptomyces sp. NBC_01381]|uniref:serine/threonine-protein kinase n=1 Tax=Streptomyces sp. NBC_01381 TaxID=2903845 RepID=UPI0022504088|nr:serine/threonine-protein kinase [Streptomyces sp. NBC_01381]MCX4672584.1 serine/threonine protein kinase [Streptomyces sp. NBC_01381]
MEALQAGDPDRVGGYRLVGRLGAGGMGQVFLGRSAGGRPVAVKLVRPEYGTDAGFRRSFAREVEAARRVGGFYTAQVIDADPHAERPWLVSAYVPGPSLQTAVSEHGTLPAKTLRVLAAGLAEGLGAVHNCALVHRDLKPGNVILASDGPRVIDFGIARALEATTHTATGVISGTPAYMSPEQARGDTDITPASDVFSLGSVLAFASTGASPFGVGHPAAVLYRIVQEEPDLSLVDNELRGLVAACLAKDPAARPEMAEILRAFAGADASDDWLPQRVTTLIGDVEAEIGNDADDGDDFYDAEGGSIEDGDLDGLGGLGARASRDGATRRDTTAPDSPPRRGLSRFVPGRRRAAAGTSPAVAEPGSVEWGWNGLPWGATVADFRARFSAATQENGEWWVTGQGPETFCDVVMNTQYGFNARGRLYLVVFYPEAEDRERLPVAVLTTMGAPDGSTTKWTRGKVVVDVKVAGIAASITHLGFDDAR